MLRWLKVLWATAGELIQKFCYWYIRLLFRRRSAHFVRSNYYSFDEIYGIISGTGWSSSKEQTYFNTVEQRDMKLFIRALLEDYGYTEEQLLSVSTIAAWDLWPFDYCLQGGAMGFGLYFRGRGMALYWLLPLHWHEVIMIAGRLILLVFLFWTDNMVGWRGIFGRWPWDCW